MNGSRTGSLRTDEKTGLIFRCWKADEPAAVFLLVHGLGAHSGRWGFFADYALRRGISSYAIELKGFGLTKTPRGHIDSFAIYYDDITRLSGMIRGENPGKKIFLLGESLGAIIAIRAASAAPQAFNGLVCISPAFQSALKLGPLDYLKIAALLVIDPRKQITMPFNSQMCTRDEAYQKEMDSNPLEHRLATPKFLFNTAVAQVRSALFGAEFKIPVLFALAGEDRLVDPEASARAFERIRAEDKEMLRYPAMYHALSIETGKETVFGDILKWAKMRL